MFRQLISYLYCIGGAHNLFTEKINNIVLGANDCNMLHTFGQLISYPYGAGAERVSKAEVMRYQKI